MLFDRGIYFQIVWSPERFTHKPQLKCYQQNATETGYVKVQSVLPDLSGFKVGFVTRSNIIPCIKYFLFLCPITV